MKHPENSNISKLILLNEDWKYNPSEAKIDYIIFFVQNNLSLELQTDTNKEISNAKKNTFISYLIPSLFFLPPLLLFGFIPAILSTLFLAFFLWYLNKVSDDYNWNNFLSSGNSETCPFLPYREFIKMKTTGQPLRQDKWLLLDGYTY